MNIKIPSKTNTSRLGRYVILVLWILCLLVFEFQAFNREFLLTNTSSLEQITLSLSTASSYQIELNDELVLTTGIDPFLMFSDLDVVVKSVDINCDITADSNSSQLFFAVKGESLSEDNSIRFALGQADNLVFFPNQLLIDSLRFDLSDRSGDRLICENFVLNPKIPYNWGSTRNFVYALLIGLAIFLLFKLPKPAREKLVVIAVPFQMALFCGLIIWMDLSYPLTFAYDSGRYLWLSSLIKTGDLAQWDVIRNLVFPLHLLLSRTTFGDTSTGLIIPMIILHLVTVGGLYWFTLECIRIKSNVAKLIVGLILFILVGVDPNVTGYFHAVLTEYMVTSIAVVSSLLALTLYRSKVGSVKFWRLNGALIFLSAVGWHIKQPYIGVALFPHVIVFTLLLLRRFNFRLVLIGVEVGLILVVLVLGSTKGWESYLAAQGNPIKQESLFTSLLQRSFSGLSTTVSHLEENYLEYLGNKYLTSSNYYYLDRSDGSIVKNPSLSRGAQNRQISQNIYIIGMSNLINVLSHQDQAIPYYAQSSPPLWLNNLMQAMIIQSNVRFTLSFLLLPIFVLGIAACWLFRKGYIGAGLLILTGSSLLNAIVHTISAGPLDRYFFWGFPLNMAALTIVSFIVVRWLAKKSQTQDTIDKIIEPL